ncbi:hypothetical protein CVT26_004680 [Gymnopilus dilepis]|uniref:F-box domain-containing protein n=1 Tax=Gymnopilus dilepis TaxID=231916 RepID=A0A409XZ38_9AGAR|nr:hypothetical protein CVT26_004680 [Gymnopilus dilepis]
MRYPDQVDSEFHRRRLKEARDGSAFFRILSTLSGNYRAAVVNEVLTQPLLKSSILSLTIRFGSLKFSSPTTRPMSSPTATFTSLRLLPELFPLIASHLPVYATPSTLLSLALASCETNDIVYDLLYRCLILRNESHAIDMFQQILDNADLGKKVRELHVRSELSAATIQGQTVFDTLTYETVEEKPWYLVQGYGEFRSEFWDNVERNCPRLQRISISGIGECYTHPWLQHSGIYELKRMKNLKSLELNFCEGSHSYFEGTDVLLSNIHHLSSTLDTLELELYHKYDSASPILTLDFPRLRSLTLGMFSVPNTEQAMHFWRRHPSIEILRLRDSDHTSHWFSSDIPDDLLPNIKHLEASFHDVRSLIPILHRLKRLSVQQSLNAQVPYLLRVLIPEGLPNLCSLEIDQEWYSIPDILRRYEGSTWFETPDREFMEGMTATRLSKKLTADFLLSIVKGAPGLQELCLYGHLLHSSTVANLSANLSHFVQLKRLYYRGLNDSHWHLRTQEDRQAFYASSREIAKK